MYIFEDAPYGNTHAFRSQFSRRLEKCDYRIAQGAPEELLPQPEERSEEDLQQLEKFVNSVYLELGIIDVKVGSLTQVSSVLLVLSGLSASKLFSGSSAQVASVSVALFFLSLAVVFSLSVIWLHWFPETDAGAPESKLRRLLLIRNKRTRRYRAGWYCTLVGAVFTFATLILEPHSQKQTLVLLKASSVDFCVSETREHGDTAPVGISLLAVQCLRSRP